MSDVREAADTAPRNLGLAIVKAYHARDEDALTRNIISLVAAAERAEQVRGLVEDLDAWLSDQPDEETRAAQSQTRAILEILS